MSKRKRLLATVTLLVLLSFGSRAASAQNVKPLVEIPFEFIHNQIVVEVKLGGKGPFHMLVNTNTDASAIDSATARELGLQAGAKGYPASGGGTDAGVVSATTIPTVELGSITAKAISVAIIDLAKLSRRLERPINGVLGYSFLRDRIIQIDYTASKIRFYAESPYPGIQLAPNTVNRSAVPFRFEDGGVVIDSVFVNGQKMHATLDTGSSGAFALTPEAIKMLALEEEARDGPGEKSVGNSGESEEKVVILKSIRIGRLAVDSTPATFWLPGTGHDNKKFQVNIGNDFLKDFLMTFDFRAKVVVFERVE